VRSSPAFSRHIPALRVLYLYSFAALEWCLGQVAISADQPALGFWAFSGFDSNNLTDAGLTLQAGLRYLHASWPVDDLMRLYLTDTAPAQYQLVPADIWIEVRGSRGEFQINRFDIAEFVFRKAILDGHSIGAAAEHALDTDSGFDVGRAFATLVTSGHVVGTMLPSLGGRP
jgi:hypothetical protein